MNTPSSPAPELVIPETAGNVAMESSFWTTVREKLHLDSLFDALKDSQDSLINIGIFAGVGVLCGFLLKKYSSFFITFALVISLFVILAQFDLLLVSINWTKAYNLAGLSDSTQASSESFFLMSWDWIKTNVSLSISFIIGFLIGLKIG